MTIMQTNFTAVQLANSDIKEADGILRSCVHCGFCTATCPTYVLLGDELDSPRGRIYLIKDMLENDRPATEDVVKHIDRCLSCLSCMTTCPSGVHYMHLVDHARHHIEKTYRRSQRFPDGPGPSGPARPSAARPGPPAQEPIEQALRQGEGDAYQPQRGYGGVDGRNADLLPRQMHLKTAKVLARVRLSTAEL